MSMPEQKHRSEKRLAIVIVLVVLALTGAAGFIFYNNILNGNSGVLQAAAAATDKSGASSALDGLKIMCSTTSTDTSGLPYSAHRLFHLRSFESIQISNGLDLENHY